MERTTQSFNTPSLWNQFISLAILSAVALTKILQSSNFVQEFFLFERNNTWLKVVISTQSTLVF